MLKPRIYTASLNTRALRSSRPAPGPPGHGERRHHPPGTAPGRGGAARRLPETHRPSSDKARAGSAAWLLHPTATRERLRRLRGPQPPSRRGAALPRDGEKTPPPPHTHFPPLPPAGRAGGVRGVPAARAAPAPRAAGPTAAADRRRGLGGERGGGRRRVGRSGHLRAQRGEGRGVIYSPAANLGSGITRPAERGTCRQDSPHPAERRRPL